MGWFIWGLAAVFYFTDYMARVAPSVMHRVLQLDFGINEVGFSMLTASFYIPYVLMQMPVGIIVDRFNMRGLLTIMSLITALGCIIFGLSSGLGMAMVARIMIGFSAAFAFISALRLATSWFLPSQLGLLAGLTQALGMLGASAGQAPLSFLVSSIGWRGSLFSISLLFIILSGLLYYYVQERPINPNLNKNSSNINNLGIWKSLSMLLMHRKIWFNALYAGFLYAPTAVIGEAIGPAYLQYGQGLSDHSAAFAIGLIFIGWVVGGPLVGALSDRFERRQLFLLLSAFFGFIFMSLFVFYPHMNKYILYILFFLYGLTNTGVAIAYAVSTSVKIRAIVGTSIAFTNMMSILIGACMQPLVGLLIDHTSGARAYDVKALLLSDFQAGLWLLPVSSLVAFGLACFVRDEKLA